VDHVDDGDVIEDQQRQGEHDFSVTDQTSSVPR
jgi:hypothetical protein